MRSKSWLLQTGCHLLLGTLVFFYSLPATAQAHLSAFEVATVKAVPGADPNTGSWSIPGTGRFSATHVSLGRLIQLAYGIDSSQIANKPGWLETELYDVIAKPEKGVQLSRDELKPLLQDLLQKRFHLVVHRATRPTRGYALVVAKGGPNLTLTKADHFAGYRINVSPGQMRGRNWSMPIFAKYLTPAADFPVIDQTGLTGSYDIDFVYASSTEADSTPPSLAVALKEATGLTLKPQMVPVEMVVIDFVDRVPTEN